MKALVGRAVRVAVATVLLSEEIETFHSATVSSEPQAPLELAPTEPHDVAALAATQVQVQTGAEHRHTTVMELVPEAIYHVCTFLTLGDMARLISTCPELNSLAAGPGLWRALAASLRSKLGVLRATTDEQEAEMDDLHSRLAHAAVEMSPALDDARASLQTVAAGGLAETYELFVETLDDSPTAWLRQVLQAVQLYVCSVLGVPYSDEDFLPRLLRVTLDGLPDPAVQMASSALCRFSGPPRHAAGSPLARHFGALLCQWCGAICAYADRALPLRARRRTLASRLETSRTARRNVVRQLQQVDARVAREMARDFSSRHTNGDAEQPGDYDQDDYY